MKEKKTNMGKQQNFKTGNNFLCENFSCPSQT